MNANERPSGEKTGNRSSVVERALRSRRPEPSAPTRRIRHRLDGASFASKRSVRPSGDQLGLTAWFPLAYRSRIAPVDASASSSRVAPAPSAPAYVLKATARPSGDHTGPRLQLGVRTPDASSV